MLFFSALHLRCGVFLCLRCDANSVRSVDRGAGKEYTYMYENSMLVRSAEANVEFNGEIVTSKVIVNTVKYYYDTEGKMTKKVITPASGSAQTIYYETNDGNTVIKFSAGTKTVTSHSKTDSFGGRQRRLLIAQLHNEIGKRL